MALYSHREDNILYMFRCHVHHHQGELLLFTWLATGSGVGPLRTG